jgi:hypothetical protein
LASKEPDLIVTGESLFEGLPEYDDLYAPQWRKVL